MKQRTMMGAGVFSLAAALLVLLSSPAFGQIDFFPGQPKASRGMERQGGRKATVLFFISPGCDSCPEEASRVGKELRRLGIGYAIEGVFVGQPEQLGPYLARLGRYPFDFELRLDMAGRLAGDYGVRAFPSAVIGLDGRRTVISHGDELVGRIP